MSKTTKRTTLKDNSMGPNSPASREASIVAVESLVFSLITAEWPMTPAKSTQQKKKETVEDGKAKKVTEATMKQSAKTKAVKPMPKAGDGLTWSQVIVSIGSTVINCTDGSVSCGTPMLVLVYDSKGITVDMSQVPEELPPPPILVDICRGKTDRCSRV